LTFVLTTDSLKADFESAVDGIKMHLLHKSSRTGLLFIGELIAGSSFSPKMVLALGCISCTHTVILITVIKTDLYQPQVMRGKELFCLQRVLVLVQRYNAVLLHK